MVIKPCNKSPRRYLKKFFMALPGVKKQTKMESLALYALYAGFISCFAVSCSAPGNFAQQYYKRNEATISRIEKLYNGVYQDRPLAAAFSDQSFDQIRLEIKTD